MSSQEQTELNQRENKPNKHTYILHQMTINYLPFRFHSLRYHLRFGKQKSANRANSLDNNCDRHVNVLWYILFFSLYFLHKMHLRSVGYFMESYLERKKKKGKNCVFCFGNSSVKTAKECTPWELVMVGGKKGIGKMGEWKIFIYLDCCW